VNEDFIYTFIQDDPPPAAPLHQRDQRLVAFIIHLKQNPGVWYVWRENAKHAISHKRTHPGTVWTSRRDKATGLYKTWAKYVEPEVGL
jgi:hypothetical protein